MHLLRLRLQNFRCCEDATIQFDQYTCLVGPNGAGKSTVLTALNVLFRHASGTTTPVVSLAQEDFCNRNTSQPIILTATFGELSKDEAAEFRDYVRQGELTLTARAHWDAATGCATVKQFGTRLVMESFAPWFRAAGENVKVAELRVLYTDLKALYPEIPNASSKADMEQRLRDYEESHRELCTLVDSEDQFYGWSKGDNRLKKYIQWVYVPAVKDAGGEQEEARTTALGELLQRTIRSKVDFEAPLSGLRAELSQRYQEVLATRQQGLADLTTALQDRLQTWSHPGAKLELRWQYDPDRSVTVASPTAKAVIGEADFLGDVARLGHGMQRSFIVSILQELAADHGANAPTLLLGFEEPELYQHPPQAKYLAGVLEQLTAHNAQVIVTTHSPYFVSGRGFANMRMVRKRRDTARSVVTSVTMEKLAGTLAAALGEKPEPPSQVMAAVEQILQPSQNELFFCNLPILVEGIEDIAFVATQLQLSGRWTDFRKLGGNFVVAAGKTNLSRPLAIANELGIPAFVLFDGDTDQNRPEEITRNRRDNGCLLRLCGVTAFEPLPSEPLWSERAVMWHTRIDDVVRDDVGVAVWEDAVSNVERRNDFIGVGRKNALHITATLEYLWDKRTRSGVLDRLCDAIFEYARQYS